MFYWIPSLSEQAADEMRQYVKLLEAQKAAGFKSEEVGSLIDPGLDDPGGTDEEEEEHREISEMEFTWNRLAEIVHVHWFKKCVVCLNIYIEVYRYVIIGYIYIYSTVILIYIEVYSTVIIIKCIYRLIIGLVGVLWQQILLSILSQYNLL